MNTSATGWLSREELQRAFEKYKVKVTMYDLDKSLSVIDEA